MDARIYILYNELTCTHYISDSVYLEEDGEGESGEETLL